MKKTKWGWLIDLLDLRIGDRDVVRFTPRGESLSIRYCNNVRAILSKHKTTCQFRWSVRQVHNLVVVRRVGYWGGVESGWHLSGKHHRWQLGNSEWQALGTNERKLEDHGWFGRIELTRADTLARHQPMMEQGGDRCKDEPQSSF